MNIITEEENKGLTLKTPKKLLTFKDFEIKTIENNPDIKFELYASTWDIGQPYQIFNENESMKGYIVKSDKTGKIIPFIEQSKVRGSRIFYCLDASYYMQDGWGFKIKLPSEYKVRLKIDTFSKKYNQNTTTTSYDTKAQSAMKRKNNSNDD